MLEPIKTERLYNIIMRRITDLINEQKLGPGDRLPSERELAAALSVSRVSVRQAITALSAKGILVMRQGDGTYVSEEGGDSNTLELFGRFLAGSQINPTEILEVRIIVECNNAKLCAQRAEDKQLQKLERLLERKRMAERTDSSLEAMNRDLHTAIAEGARNKALLRIMEVVWDITGNNMWPLLKGETNNREQQISLHLDQHEEIVAAIRTRDPEKAYQSMYRHLSAIEEEMDALLIN
ncbi:FadR family transcriptional regulator [Treponema sp. OttesenSCG-928-L16]|nr:FadR family transcriptional regulator [Treponema sp. OttesenSCG-928-L16]